MRLQQLTVKASALTLLLLAAIASASPTDELNRVGEARLRYFLFHIYDSTLFSADGVFSGIEPKLALQIDYQRRIKAGRLLDQTREEWMKQSLYDDASEDWLRQLAVFWVTVPGPWAEGYAPTLARTSTCSARKRPQASRARDPSMTLSRA